MARISILALAAIIAVSPIRAFAQAGPSTLPSTATVAQTPGLTLRSLPAVLDARERHQDWHAAVDQAGSRIQDPALKTQFNQRMSGIVPTVAKLLMGHPREYALLTVGVYRSKASPEKQVMAAVTLNGLESQLGSDFFPDVLSGLPHIPAGQGIPDGLQLDTDATSYLVFFLGEKRLEAGGIPHATFGKSIMLATSRAHNSTNEAQSAAAEDAIARTNAAQAQVNADRLPEGADANQQPNLYNGAVTNGYDGQTAGYGEPGNPYGIAYNYPPSKDGYYYPGIGVPYVILLNEAETTPESQKRQIEREHFLESDYRQRAGIYGSANPATGIGNIATGASQNSGIADEAAPSNRMNVNPAATSGGTSSGQGSTTPRTFLQPGQAGGAPAGSHAPAMPSGGSGGGAHPAAGAPGGPPVRNGTKK